MDTVRVKIAYRPLRICWAIKEGDVTAFQDAVRTNHALWGGRFNPIVVVDRPREAGAIAEAFRADIVFPLGESDEVKIFAAKYKHLISPFLPDAIFVGKDRDARAQVLDVQNAIVHSVDAPDWKQIKEMKPRVYTWAADDPLGNVLLMQLGAYPPNETIYVDYESMFRGALGADEVRIDAAADLPPELFNHPSIAYLSRHRLERHYGIQSYWDYPGFFVGDASNLLDLVAFWNLRATDISLLFVDRTYAGRYAAQIPAWKEHTGQLLSRRRFREDQKYAIWWRRERLDDHGDIEALQGIVGKEPCTICGVDEFLWNGLNLKPPMMYFSEVASLGVLTDAERPKLSFGLNDRPYADDPWFHTQNLVASISISGGLYGRDDFTVLPPYVPELNEFFARAMYLHYGRLRVESERVALVIHASDTDSFLYALPTAEVFKQVFALAGFTATVSSGGLITRQLISQLGGLQGARVFKIAGARRLLKTYGPTSSFTKRSALQLIGGKDPDNPNATFDQHKDLYLEPREHGADLAPPDVFGYLVRKRLFRIGTELTCPRCQLRSWFPVDDLQQRVNCQMCGEPFDATHQLIKSYN